jgi:hypothetical protein
MPDNDIPRPKWKDLILICISCLKRKKIHSSCCEIDINNVSEPPTPTPTPTDKII